MARSRILVAVSTPWASEKLCASISDLAQRLDGSVVVAHVAQTQEEDESESDARQRGEETLKALTEKLEEKGVDCQGVLLFGDAVGRAILNAAQAHDVSLVVLGATGKGRVARLLAGDVPQHVIRSAQLPVLVFPPDWSGTV